MIIEIKRFTPNMIEDYLHFFDTEAHADNPDPGEQGCYCVCRDAADEGFDVVEAYPSKVFDNEFRDFMGPLALYEKLGFTMHEEYDHKYKNCFIMWKELTK